MAGATSRARGAGRPAASDGEPVRRALLDAARDRFAQKPYAAVSVRELAAAAGVNPGMIHYYFGSKSGLYLALFEEAVGPVLERLAGSGHAVPDLEQVVAGFMRALSRHPWLPTLLLRDVYATDSPVRAEFIARYAGRAAPMLQRLVGAAQAEGRLPRGTDPRLAVLSLLGLCVFPFVAAPVAREVLGLDYGDEQVEAMIEHNLGLLRGGLYR